MFLAKERGLLSFCPENAVFMTVFRLFLAVFYSVIGWGFEQKVAKMS